jgi:hypothetical protein
MTIAKTLASVQRTKQFKNLIASNLVLASTDRQLSNGTLVFTGKIGRGRKAVHTKYAITANGAVISNEFTVRRVVSETAIETYRQGLAAISELFERRLAA